MPRCGIVSGGRRTVVRGLAGAVACWLAGAALSAAQVRPRVTTAVGRAAALSMDRQVTTMREAGTLTLAREEADPLVRGRLHRRLRQVHNGVPVYGADLTQQVDATGAPVSLFGTTFADLALDTTPALSAGDAARLIESRTGVLLGASRAPDLVILPVDDGARLAWRGRVFTADGALELFLDAQDGRVLLERDAAQRQSAIGKGTGVLADPQKLSVLAQSGTYLASDALRPPQLLTFDLRESLSRTLAFLNGTTSLGSSDLAADSDNVWTDGAVVDAHAYAGYFYDFYFKRFGRRGLDGNNFRMLSLVHPVPRADVASQPSSVVGLYYLNAFYAGGGVMVYGEGLPPNYTAGGQRWNYLSGALDIVAHELTHGVTDFTSNLIYDGESGALNESFSDMMATAVEFYAQPAGSGLLKADYLIGEDVITPGGIRSLENPAAYGQPDHYSKRLIVPSTTDNGGVHTNSGIPNQVYYLAIEGGTNRTSGLRVTGVGGSNRDQIDKCMYRAFTQLMPARATFSIARAATLQAATDLYGASSAAARALAQAWTAVGVD